MPSPTKFDPQYLCQEIVSFIKKTFESQQKKHAVIAVSGGIDSAVSLTLTVKALGPESVFPIFLPFKDQSVADSEKIAEHALIPQSLWREYNIENVVEAVKETKEISDSDVYRMGNIMARARMILVYDTAKELDALVVGTENKSEKYLGYFTRFGDEASDIEPLQHLYKSDVRALAEYLSIPEIFLTKQPSAGLWRDQTDESELGFSYEHADVVLRELIDKKIPAHEIVLPEISPTIIQAVCQRVVDQKFKHEVPYTL